MTEYALRTISLGAGVQSSTLYLMACEGLVGPKPDVAIFADTGAEPPHTYEYLWWLAENFGHIIPIHVVSAGDVGADALRSMDGETRWSSIPFRVASQSFGKASMLNRNCTRDYKIEPIKKHVRTLLGLAKGQRVGELRCEEWIGISLDEAIRMKPSRYPLTESRWPLIEMRMTRRDCLAWLERNGHRVPKKSACYFCPFHDDGTWRSMRDNEPELWAKAVWFDEQIRKGKLRGVDEDAYLHGSLKPLSEVDLSTAEDRGQLNLNFGNECEGMCGV